MSSGPDSFWVPLIAVSIFATLFLSNAALAAETEPVNLVADGSFEVSAPPDHFGHVFPKWGGWKYEGDCEFRVGRVCALRPELLSPVRGQHSKNPYFTDAQGN